MARPTPVLPEVGSLIVPPGRSTTDASAASTMRSAIRSFTEPPGLKYSTLASTPGPPAPSCWVTRRSLTSGVFPTSSIRESWTCITSHLLGGSGPGTRCAAGLLHRRYPTPAVPRPCSRAPGPHRRDHVDMPVPCRHAHDHASPITHPGVAPHSWRNGRPWNNLPGWDADISY